jgi:hypothetical protein
MFRCGCIIFLIRAFFKPFFIHKGRFFRDFSWVGTWRPRGESFWGRSWGSSWGSFRYKCELFLLNLRPSALPRRTFTRVRVRSPHYKGGPAVRATERHHGFLGQRVEIGWRSRPLVLVILYTWRLWRLLSRFFTYKMKNKPNLNRLLHSYNHVM